MCKYTHAYIIKLKHILVCVICAQVVLDVPTTLKRMLKSYETHP